MGWNEVGFNGLDPEITPHIDRFRYERNQFDPVLCARSLCTDSGCVFDRAVCLPHLERLAIGRFRQTELSEESRANFGAEY